MQPVSKTLKSGPLIKFHSFDDVCCIVGCDARLVLFFQTHAWQTLSQSQGKILSSVVSGKVCCLQAATFQLKVVIYKLYSQTKIRLGHSAWPHISSCGLTHFSALLPLFLYTPRTAERWQPGWSRCGRKSHIFCPACRGGFYIHLWRPC